LAQTPNPQSPIPNPQSPTIFGYIKVIYLNKVRLKQIFKNIL